MDIQACSGVVGSEGFLQAPGGFKHPILVWGVGLNRPEQAVPHKALSLHQHARFASHCHKAQLKDNSSAHSHQGGCYCMALSCNTGCTCGPPDQAAVGPSAAPVQDFSRWFAL